MNLNKQTATYIFIFIFIIITFIHLYKINNKHNNNNNDKENFVDLMEDQNLQGFSVSINSMEQVFFGNTPDTKLSLKTFMNEKADKTELSILNNKVEEKSSKTELNNNVDELNNKINDAMPELSIISYAGSNPPTGWQPCDGKLLEYSNSNNRPVRIDDTRTLNFNEANGFRKTPDLRGRFILGSGEGDGLTQRDIHTNGGEETHTLTVAEMPAHSHTYTAREDASDKYDGGSYGLPARRSPTRDTSTVGGNAPHNNMPPFYVLTYIIKQPLPP